MQLTRQPAARCGCGRGVWSLCGLATIRSPLGNLPNVGDVTLDCHALMPPDRTHTEHQFDQRSSTAGSRLDARTFIRQTLLLAGLILVTCCRFADASGRIALPATWLMIALLVVSGWTGSRAVALGSAAITLFVWSWIETSRADDWTQLVFGQAMRLLVALWLVVWMGRLRERLAESHRFARLDPLTGLPNRQALIEALDAELSRARRFGRSFTLALFDCDGFKGINDRDGHPAGDTVLRQIGVALRQHTRPYDCVGRLGGDEFLLVLSEVDREEATLIAERLRAALRHFVERAHPALTFSLGVVTFQTGDLDWEDCIQQTDEAMYAAKHQGPDQTRFEVILAPAVRTLPLSK